MKNPVFWRVIWKEYRQIRAFWLAIVVFAVMLEAIMSIAAMFPASEIPVEVFYAIAFILPVFYGLGCGAVMFAGEHEADTYDFQRALPVSARQLLGGKLCFAMLSGLLLPSLLWVIAWLCAGRALPRNGLEHLGQWLFGLGMSVELFAWAALFSLLLGRVLWATVLSMGFVCLVGIAAIPSLDFFVARAFERNHTGHPLALALHVIVTLFVLAADIWLGRRWLREYPLPWSRPSSSARQARQASAHRQHGQRTAIWGRLIWHAWIQARWTLAIILAIAGCSVAFPLIVDIFAASSITRLARIPLTMGPLVAAVVGATVFWSDQRKEQFRFFTERGISPRRVWASRQVVAIAAVILWFALSLICLMGEVASARQWYTLGNEQTGVLAHYTIYGEVVQTLQAVVGLGILCYAVGQICSLSVRSGVIGLFLGMLLAWAAAMWAMLMWTLHVPLWFSVAPIPLVLFWASWLRAPAWLVERANWRCRMRLAVAITVPLATIAVAVVCYRVYEIPVSRSPITAEDRQVRLSPEGLRTAVLYYGAFYDFPSPDEAASFEGESTTDAAQERSVNDGQVPEKVELLARGVQEFMDASRRKTCQFPSPQLRRQSGTGVSEANLQLAEIVAWHAVRLAQSVLGTCNALERDGQLDAALDRYMAVLAFARHLYDDADWPRQQRADAVEAMVLARLPLWAAHPSQTAESVRAALGRLEREHFQFTPSRRDGIIQDYLSYRQLLDMDLPEDSHVTAHEAFTVWFFSHFLPWEHARAKRLLEYGAAGELLRLKVIEKLVMSGQCVHKVEDQFWDADVVDLVKSTPGFARQDWTAAEATMADVVALWATRRRIARLQLALAAWRIEHGRLPRTLDQLIGNELESLPVDPFTGRAFRYQPDGFGLPIVSSNPVRVGLDRYELSEVPMEAGTPFLWSAGTDIVYSPYTNSRTVASPGRDGFSHVDYIYSEFTHVDYIYRPRNARTPQPITTEQDLWAGGICFPVP